MKKRSQLAVEWFFRYIRTAVDGGIYTDMINRQQHLVSHLPYTLTEVSMHSQHRDVCWPGSRHVLRLREKLRNLTVIVSCAPQPLRITQYQLPMAEQLSHWGTNQAWDAHSSDMKSSLWFIGTASIPPKIIDQWLSNFPPITYHFCVIKWFYFACI